ncbi:MAG: sigma factor-like helix-turn-helix DNA-binding protein [Curtobacterium sp.]
MRSTGSAAWKPPARSRDLRIGTRDHHSIDHGTDRWDTLFIRSRLRDALAGLTQKQRDAVLLRYLGEHSAPEVAAVLGTTIGTAKTRVRDGLTALRNHLHADATAA